MNSKFFRVVNDFNLSTYYLLPLLRLNKYSFGSPLNFVDCYVTPEGEYLVVKLKQMVPFLYRENEHYKGDFVGDDDLVNVLLRIPDEFADDVAQFMTGKYSQMSSDAKEMIRSYSGLIYRQEHPKTGKSTTDARIMALDEDPEQRAILRRKIEEEIGCSLPENVELMSKPSDNNYIELTNDGYLSRSV